ncbi:MAG: hypothetical protein KKA84_12150 [Bacteroidetes bacterium]|nr:hypothetical protein [Bacteroidota bacterium]
MLIGRDIVGSISKFNTTKVSAVFTTVLVLSSFAMTPSTKAQGTTTNLNVSLPVTNVSLATDILSATKNLQIMLPGSTPKLSTSTDKVNAQVTDANITTKVVINISTVGLTYNNAVTSPKFISNISTVLILGTPINVTAKVSTDSSPVLLGANAPITQTTLISNVLFISTKRLQLSTLTLLPILRTDTTTTLAQVTSLVSSASQKTDVPTLALGLTGATVTPRILGIGVTAQLSGTPATMLPKVTTSSTFVSAATGPAVTSFRVWQHIDVPTMSVSISSAITGSRITRSTTIASLEATSLELNMELTIQSDTVGLEISAGETTFFTPDYTVNWEQGGPDFKVGDLLLSYRKDFDETATQVEMYWVKAEVTRIDTEGEAEIRLLDGTLSWKDFEDNSDGIEFVKVGNKTDVTRQGSILLTSDFENAPYIDVKDGTDSFDAFFNALPKVRMGLLDGLDDNFGTEETPYYPTGYGLYGQNIFLRGMLVITGGATHDLILSKLDQDDLPSWVGNNATVLAALEGETIIDGGLIATSYLSASNIQTGTLVSVAYKSSNSNSRIEISAGNSITFYWDSWTVGSLSGTLIPYEAWDGVGLQTGVHSAIGCSNWLQASGFSGSFRMPGISQTTGNYPKPANLLTTNMYGIITESSVSVATIAALEQRIYDLENPSFPA